MDVMVYNVGHERSGPYLSARSQADLRTAIEDVIHGSGWGSVKLIIEKGRVVKLAVEQNRWLDRPTTK